MSHGHEVINRIVTTLPDGRTIAKGVGVIALPPGGMVYLLVTIPHLRYVEEVINIQWNTQNAQMDYVDVGNKNYDGNVVGVTLSGDGTGGTITLEVIAIGI